MKQSLTERKWPWIVGTVVLALAMVWGNTFQRQREQYRIARVADQDGRLIEAIAAYESTLHMYTPFSSTIPAAADRLWEIGEQLEGDDRIDEALVAFRSLRSSFYAIRSFYQPYPEWIPRCDEKIAQLMQQQEARLAAAEAPESGAQDVAPSPTPDIDPAP